MKRNSKIILLLIALALIPAIVKLQAKIDPQRAQFQPGKGISAMKVDVGNNPVILPSQFVLGTLIGFREVVAGLLWVRVDEFFHTGDYEAIIPLMRIITWLDPHQIDVYSTGAWHLAYNLVDSNQRADFRYIAPAIAFLQEAIQNNPGVWDPEFDLGFVIYSLKLCDFEKAIYWESKAAKEKNALLHLHRQVAHAYEKAGRIDEAIRQWRFCVKQAQALVKKNPTDTRPFASNHLEVSKRNLDRILVQKAIRVGLEKHRIEVGLEVNFKRVGPRVFIISGKANLPDATRLSLTLLDEDFKLPNQKAFNWEVDPNATAVVDIGIHGIYLDNGKFEHKYDLSKDPKQYPFKKDKYVLTIYYDPREAYEDAQDIVGWHGEGLTDKNYLDTSIPGIRRVVKVIYLDRKDII